MEEVVLHIDADIIPYAVGFVTQDEPLSFALHSAKQMIKRIERACQAERSILYISGATNFRNDVATIQEYKANRKDQEKPLHHAAIRKYIIKNYNPIISDNCEADDLLGIACSADDGNINILASIDKDLKMIAGHHYTWQKEKEGLFEVSEEEADDFFLIQLLTGDATDNIPGLKRLTGKMATAKKKEYVLEGEGFVDKWERVREVYMDCLMESNEDLSEENAHQEATVCLTEIGSLLWMQRTNYLTWESYYESKKT